MIYICFSIYFSINLIALILFRKNLALNPSAGFIFFNFLTGIGVFLLVDLNIYSNELYIYLTILCTFCFIVGSFFGFVFFDNSKHFKNFYLKEKFFLKKDVYLGWFFLLISVLVTLIYFKLLGYNLFISAIMGDVSNFTDMRLASYNGDNYLASGYVNQFKNTLLPICFIFVFLILKKAYKPYFLLFFLPLVLYGLLGNGQRTFLAMFILQCIFIYSGISGKVLNGRLLFYSLLPFLSIFGYMSYALGRVEGFSAFDSISALVFRIFASNQIGAVVGFDYIYNVEKVQFLKEWIEGIKGFLPGYSGSKISFIIHDILYSSDRGTAPLGIWGSIYYNLGFFGALVFSFLLGFIYQFVYKLILTGHNNIFRVVLYSCVVMYMSIWFSGAPDQMINNGILAVIMVLFLRKINFKLR